MNEKRNLDVKISDVNRMLVTNLPYNNHLNAQMKI
jgi:hypothetical protein